MKPTRKILMLSEVRAGPPRARVTDVAITRDDYREAAKNLEALKTPSRAKIAAAIRRACYA